jgi:hypothetical protein
LKLIEIVRAECQRYHVFEIKQEQLAITNDGFVHKENEDLSIENLDTL